MSKRPLPFPVVAPWVSSAWAVAAAWAPLLLFAGICLLHLGHTRPVPQDDLLRNAVAWAWNYDYRLLYPAAPGMPAFNPYRGFDHLLSWPARAWGPEVAAALAQGLLAALFLGTLWAGLRRRAPAVPVATLAWLPLLVLASYASSRLSAARPEVLATAWCLSAAFLRPGIWLGMGILVGPMYWLSPVYALGGLMLSGSWPRRFAWVGAGGLAAAAGWCLAYPADYLPALLQLGTLSQHRPVPALEALPPHTLVRYPGQWPLLLAIVLTAGLLWLQRPLTPDISTTRPRWTGIAATLIAFWPLLAARHVLLVAGLLALLLAHAWQQLLSARSLPRTSKALAGFWPALRIPAAVVLAVSACSQWVGAAQQPRFELPPGTVVLTEYSPAVFSLPHANPGRVQVLPSIESGWDAPAVVAVAQALKQGRLSCEQLLALSPRPTFIVTRLETAKDCLQESGRQGAWRLYAVRPGRP